MKRILLASVAAIVLSAGAAEADGYLSILGGPTWDPGLTVGNTKQGMDTGYNFGARAGYNLDEYGLRNFSTELDLFYDQSRLADVPNQHVRSLSAMADLIYHADLNLPVGVYGGAGLGVINTEYGNGAFSGSGSVLGWQLLAGLEYPLSDNTNLFTEYRYQNAHDVNVGGLPVGNTSNSLSVGLKLRL
jgi:opacity protein-like surface antigen